MDFSQFIGMPLQTVKHKLDNYKIKYIVTENSDIQKKYDSLLVVNIRELQNGLVEIITDKFLLKI